MVDRRLGLVAMMFVIAICGGCKDSKSIIHGTITYESAPIKRGEITFAPADGRGAVCSIQFQSGVYRIENVPPGKRTVQIKSFRDIPVPKTHEEASKFRPSMAPDIADEIPSAIGNNQTIETTLGDQERNFDLKRPAGSMKR
jgi:hypothetical protein